MSCPINKNLFLTAFTVVTLALFASSLSAQAGPGKNIAQSRQNQTGNADDDQMTANERMVLPSKNHQRLESSIGMWQVTQTVRASADANPVTIIGITAHRDWLEGRGVVQEIMQGAPNGKPFRRIELLTYNNIEQKFELASTDTRTPGIMSFFYPADDGSKTLTFYQTFTLGGRGRELSGQTVKLRQVLNFEDPERIVRQQFWTLPAAKEFLAIEYVYTRKK